MYIRKSVVGVGDLCGNFIGPKPSDNGNSFPCRKPGSIVVRHASSWFGSAWLNWCTLLFSCTRVGESPFHQCGYLLWYLGTNTFQKILVSVPPGHRLEGIGRNHHRQTACLATALHSCLPSSVFPQIQSILNGLCHSFIHPISPIFHIFLM